MSVQKGGQVMITKEEIAEAIRINSTSTDIKSVIFHFVDKKGKKFTKEYSDVCINEQYFCTRGWDRYGLKTYGAKYGYGNVESIKFVR